MNTLILQNENLRMEFSRENGSLTALSSVESGWKVLDRAELGLSFRLLVPLEGRRNNSVHGEQQKLSLVEEDAGGASATFTWNGVFSEYGGMHDIEVVTNVSLRDKKAVFTTTIKNKSEYMVENVYSPYLGDLRHPEDEEWFRAFMFTYASVQEFNLWPSFSNTKGYYGLEYPTMLHGGSSSGTPMTPYILLRGSRQGLYAGVEEASPELVAWHAELRPGYENSINAEVPKLDSIAGKPVSTRFAAVHLPYIQPGETRRLTPVSLKFYEGGWQRGVDIYKEWRNSWIKRPEVPQWALEPHSWQQIHINSPEDELRMTYKELVKVGEDCVRHGVKAIQLVGWNKGGQDQGNPSHDTDPRLGTWEELRDAVAQIKEMGVKVILFAKFTWADRATEEFRKNLHRLAVKDPYGDYYVYGGYHYHTVTQLLDINTKRLIPMCFLSEEYLDICDEEFKKTIALGADGILFDECQHHAPALLCFDESHGHRYASPVYANDRMLIRNFEKIVGKESEFLFAGEACYDWEYEAYHLAYFRSESKEYVPLTRYMHPFAPLMTAVTGFDDRHMINQCLMYRYIVSYEPYNFKGRLDDYPKTVEYGRIMDKLRTELREYFWDGEFRHECGAEVKTADGKLHRPYSVFENSAMGKTGLVICNYSDTEEIKVTVRLKSGALLSKYRLVDIAEWKSAEDGIVLPPRSAAVVI